MIWPFKSKRERILDGIKTFENRLNQALIPLLQKPENPIAGNGALISMAVNIALYFIAIKNLKIFKKTAPYVISHTAVVFGSMVAIGSEGKVSAEVAAKSILHEMQNTQADYSNALEKSSSNPEEALHKCLDIFLESSGGWTFKDEMSRAEATILLSIELQHLMKKFRSIL